jgi:hypothetical protein
MLLSKIVQGLTFLVIASSASASVLTSQTTFVANGTQGGNPDVNSEAVFTFTNVTPTTGILTVTLTNLLANPTSVAQNITDFSFDLVGGNGVAIVPSCATTCLTSASAPDGTVTLGSGAPTYAPTPIDPKWAVMLSSGMFYLNGTGLIHSAAHSIIGPGDSSGNYTNAGGSLTGARSPFVYSTATFTFTLSNLPANFTIGQVNFAFNSSAGDNFSCDADIAHCAPGSVLQDAASVAAPEPVSFLLVGGGLLGIFSLRRRRA